VRAGTKMNARATFIDPDANNTITAIWNWGDGTSSNGIVSNGTVTGSHTYTKPGIYLVTITIKDKDGGQGQSNRFIIVLLRR
jgi:PKD repeat protein